MIDDIYFASDAPLWLWCVCVRVCEDTTRTANEKTIREQEPQGYVKVQRFSLGR